MRVFGATADFLIIGMGVIVLVLLAGQFDFITVSLAGSDSVRQ